MAKQILYSIEARDALKRGIDAVANAVKVTLGPRGRNVVLEKKFRAAIDTLNDMDFVQEVSSIIRAYA